MQSKELNNTGDTDGKSKVTNAAHLVSSEAVQKEEMPTLPLEPVQTISPSQPEVSVRSVPFTAAVDMSAPLVVPPLAYRRSMGEWLQAGWDGIRPAYLPLALAPLWVGTVLAWIQTISVAKPLGHLRLSHFIATVLAIVLLQFGANLVNDYYDYLRGVDTSNALGPGGLIQQGIIKPTNVLYCGLAALTLGAVLGLIVAISGGPLVFLFGLIGLLCAYFYSAPPRSLASLGLGELVGFCIFGPLITLGAYMVQTGHAARAVFVYSLPLGLLAAAIIHVNNMRDAESDTQAGKRTLASIVGLRGSRGLFVALVLVAYGIVLALGLPHSAPHLILITLWTLPTLVVALTGIFRSDAPEGLHQVFREMLHLETYFAFFLIVALIALAFWPMLSHISSHGIP